MGVCFKGSRWECEVPDALCAKATLAGREAYLAARAAGRTIKQSETARRVARETTLRNDPAYNAAFAARQLTYAAAWNRNSRGRRKAISTHHRLAKRHPGELVATTSELHAALLGFLNRMGFGDAALADVLPEIDLCHYIPVEDGGTGTIDNVYWGWTSLNRGLGAAKPDLAYRMLLDMKLEMESRMLRARRETGAA